MRKVTSPLLIKWAPLNIFLWVWQKQHYNKNKRKVATSPKELFRRILIPKIGYFDYVGFSLSVKWNHVEYTNMRRNVLCIFILIFTNHSTTTDINQCFLSWKKYISTAKTAANWYRSDVFFSALNIFIKFIQCFCCSIWACITCSYVGITQPLFICSKSTKETPEQCQWCQFTLTRFHAFSSCFYCWLWTSKFLLGIDLTWIISPNNFVSTESPG